MMTNKFKVGDRVVRINSDNAGVCPETEETWEMLPGDFGTVTKVAGQWLTLKEYPGIHGHYAKNFELAASCDDLEHNDPKKYTLEGFTVHDCDVSIQLTRDFFQVSGAAVNDFETLDDGTVILAFKPDLFD